MGSLVCSGTLQCQQISIRALARHTEQPLRGPGSQGNRLPQLLSPLAFVNTALLLLPASVSLRKCHRSPGQGQGGGGAQGRAHGAAPGRTGLSRISPVPASRKAQPAKPGRKNTSERVEKKTNLFESNEFKCFCLS